MQTVTYRHKLCDAALKNGQDSAACIGCGGDMIPYDMDVPAIRADISQLGNREWIKRNLFIRNKDHELYDFVIEKIQEREKSI